MLLAAFLLSAVNLVAPAADIAESGNRCGPYSLLLCLASLGEPIDQGRFDELLPDDGRKSSLIELRNAAERLGFSAHGVRWERDIPDLPHGKAAAVIPVIWRDGRRHFIAVTESQGERFRIVDFPNPPRWIAVEVLRSGLSWDGTALVIATDREALTEVVDDGEWGPAVVAGVALLLFGAGGVFRSPLGRRTRMPRSGFSLLEAMTTIGILALLFALLAPAVQQARQAAARMDCSSRLRQIGLATQLYADTHRGRLPPANEAAVDVRTGRPVRGNLSPHARLLPYLDEDAIWRRIDLSETGQGGEGGPPASDRNPELLVTAVSVFVCPADDVPAGGTSYRMCCGSTPGIHASASQAPGAARFGVASPWGAGLRRITDGLSNTAFYSERVTGDRNPAVYDPWRDRVVIRGGGPEIDEPDEVAAVCAAPHPTDEHFSDDGGTWLLTDPAYTLYNHVLTPNSRTPDCRTVGGDAVTARSHHAGGVHVAFGDGAVRFVSESVTPAVWRAIASINGGEAVPDF